MCDMRYPSAAGRALSLMLLAASAAEGLLLARSSSSAGVRAAAGRRFAQPLLAGRFHTTTRTTAAAAAGCRSSRSSAFAYPAAAAAATTAVLDSNSDIGAIAGTTAAKPIPRTAMMSTAAANTAAAGAADTSAAASAAAVTLDTLRFDNQAIRALPVDPIPDNYVRRVENACFSVVAPDPVVKPVMVAVSSSALGLLGLGAEEGERDDAAEYFSGEFTIDMTDCCTPVQAAEHVFRSIYHTAVPCILVSHYTMSYEYNSSSTRISYVINKSACCYVYQVYDT